MKQAHVIATLGVAILFAAASLAFAPPTPPATAPSDGGATTTPKTGESGGWPPTHNDTLNVGLQAPAFIVKDSDSHAVSLTDFSGKVVVLAWVNPECPICAGKMTDGSVAKMMTAAREVDKDVVFLFVNSTASMADKPTKSKEFLATNKITAPVLVDGDGKMGKAYAALTTPHCFVINGAGVLVYAGAMDDKGSTNYVVNAVKALKESKPVKPAITAPYGTAVKY